MDKLLKFLKDEDGNAVEYALIVGLVSIGIVVAAKTLGTNLTSYYSAIAAEAGSWKLP